MCKAPGILPDGTKIPCRKCELCRARRVGDWVGRCIAEGRTSTARVVSLTYGPDDPLRAAVLTYSDFQKYMKRLRIDGYDVRYFVVGEYGELNRRAHWHAVLFFRGKVPEHRIRFNFMQEHWPHGWSFWDYADYRGIKYVMKYLVKNLASAEEQRKPGLSKKPPLGAEYFATQAAELVAAGLAPQSREYRFGEVRFRGQPRKFFLQGAALRRYLASWVIQWNLVHGRRFYPNSELVDEFLDSTVRERPFVLEPSVVRVADEQPPAFLEFWMDNAHVVYDDYLAVWRYQHPWGVIPYSWHDDHWEPDHGQTFKSPRAIEEWLRGIGWCGAETDEYVRRLGSHADD